MTREKFFGGIEAGGTKFVCIVANGPDSVFDQARIPTTSPGETLERTISFFKPHLSSGQMDSLGVGSFGPLDLNPDSPSYGYISRTPKPGWSHTDMRGTLERALQIKVSIDTDVNAAALGEYKWGASRGCDPSLYLTVGTGIGGGCIIHGRPYNGMLNPEMGHIQIPHDSILDPFMGICPFHADCFEGLASGPAIRERFGVSAETLPNEHPFWEIEAGYIAAALANYILTLSPRRIVIGGGVMGRTFLYPKIRVRVLELLQGYVAHPAVLADIENYILPPALGNLSGSLGAVALAQLAAEK